MLHGSNDKKQGTSFCSTGRAMAYGYDAIGHLTQVDAASSPSDAARYRYDAAGNPVDRAELGLDVTNSFNNLNQIVSGVWTGSTLTVAGTVNHPAGNIAVNGVGGTIYPDGSFSVANVPVALGTNTLTATYTGPAYTNAPMTATDTVSVVLANAAYTHDANGNLTGDATFAYQYDTANQLTNVIRKADNARVLSCRYDALGRRVEAIRADGTTDRYVYFPGSFLVLAVLDGSNTPKEFYTRGPDLSGALDSASGIGGILACTYSSGPVLYHHADLMGNIVSLSSVEGEQIATFEYAPFGQLICWTGSVWPRHSFSSKEQDRETNISYYGHRSYKADIGRWMSRDPLHESESLSRYGFVGNAPSLWVDAIGLTEYKFDKESCKLHVILRWRMVFVDGPFEWDVWSEDDKKQWKSDAQDVATSYFRDIKYKCYPYCEDCQTCASGVSIEFQLKYVGALSKADSVVKVYHGNVRAHTDLDGTLYLGSNPKEPELKKSSRHPGYGFAQRSILHEIGHRLGLKHPGHELGVEPNTPADYEADEPSLMGKGEVLREKDFDKAFCDHISVSEEGCNPWHGH